VEGVAYYFSIFLCNVFYSNFIYCLCGVTTKITVLWDLMPPLLIVMYERLVRKCRPHLQVRTLFWRWRQYAPSKVPICLPNKATSRHARLQFSLIGYFLNSML